VDGVAGGSGTVEAAIRSILNANITVIASANNKNGNACDTSPGRMSIDNPDTSVANDVITAGGSMIVNRPWTVNVSDVPDKVEGRRTEGAKHTMEARRKRPRPPFCAH
jgi:hypothetical protein